MDRRDTELTEIEKLVEARTRELSAFSTHLQAFSEQEKSELARKLHDELGGLLTAAKMDLSWLQSRAEGGAAIQERLSQLGTVLDEAMDLKRRVVEELRPSLLDHFGLPTAMRAYVEKTCATAGLRCEVSVEYAGQLPKDAAIGLFRVVQAGLSNIIRHSRGRLVRLILSGDDRLCSLTLTDDGQGFDSGDPQLRNSHGLMGMRQRISALGGHMDVSSHPGRGTTLQVQIPISRT